MTFQDTEFYDKEAAIINSILHEPAMRKEIFSLCLETDFTPNARHLFVQLEKAYNRETIDTQLFKTKFMLDNMTFIQSGRQQTWHRAKIDFFDDSMRRNAKMVLNTLGCALNDSDSTLGEFLEWNNRLIEIFNDSRVFKQDVKTIKHCLHDAIQRIEKQIKDEYEYTKWGIGLLDQYCMSEPQDFNIIAARPGIGKTIIALNCILGATIDHPVGYWCGEMSSPVIGLRLLSILTGVDHNRIREPKRLSQTDFVSITKAIEYASKEKIYISTSTRSTVEDIRQWVKQLVEYHDVKNVFIDYIQRLTPTNSRVSRRDQVQHMSNELKNIASEFNITVTALAAQLNRDSSGEKPKIKHLAECSHLEQDASTIILVDRVKHGEDVTKRNYWYRVPGFDRLEKCTNEHLDQNTMILSIAKSRHATEKTLYADCDLDTFQNLGEKKFKGQYEKQNDNRDN